MNTNEIIPLGKTLQETILQSEIAWDFDLSPHLFPLYLFRHFVKKYCASNDISLLQIACFDINSAILKCDRETLLTEGYSTWLLITRVWETAMSFSVMVGEKEFVPFSRSGKNCLAQVGLSVYTFEATNETTIEPWNNIRTEDDISLETAHAFTFEIKELMKQCNIKRTKE